MANPVIHWQIITKNPDRLASFYTELFDWKVDASNALRYRRLSTGSPDGIDGGIWPAPPQAHSFVQLHVRVDDVPACVAKAQSLGATVIVPPQHLPEGETMAVLHDPEGIPFAVVSPAR